MQQKILLIVAAWLFITQARAQHDPKTDSLPARKQALSQPKAYREVVPLHATTQHGFIPVTRVADQWYWEIPSRLLGREILLVTRIAKGAAPVSNSYPGDELSNLVVRFEKGAGNRILLRKVYYTTYAGDTAASLYAAVQRASEMPILATFPIEAWSPDSSLVINPTDYLLGDNECFSFSGLSKATAGLTALQADKTYLETVHSYAENLEVVTEKTFLQSLSNSRLATGQTVINTGAASFQLHTSMLLLPAVPLRQRLEEPRVGYFSLIQQDYDAAPDGLRQRAYVKRWRLEPKPEDRARYLKGEVVPPQKPIVFYIDPATPKQWVPYLVQGITDWQAAFEAAGFCGAIQAKPAPTKAEDSTWNLYDARHSAVVYKASPVENAFGLSIADPRSGEILESHINWHHNILQLVHDWYLVQCGVLDPRVQTTVFPDSVMGQLIRYVIAHEVGHALGLRHNMAASSAVPVAKLRQKAWVEANGFCPSVMDYARFNYVAQPQDSIGPRGLLPRLGAYDHWAIQWGYRWFPDSVSTTAVADALQQWTDRQLENRALWYGPEKSFYDPRIQTEDLGDNVVQAARYGIQNLRRLVPQLRTWIGGGPRGLADLARIHAAVRDQYIRYGLQAAAVVGGSYETLQGRVDGSAVFRPVPAALQQEALAFLTANYFQTPGWIADTAILARTGETAAALVDLIQTKVLSALLYPPLRMVNLWARNEQTAGAKAFTLLHLLDGLRKGVWTELDSGKPIDGFRRNLQRLYVRDMGWAYRDANRYKMVLSIDPARISGGLVPAFEVAMEIDGHLREVQRAANRVAATTNDRLTRMHLRYIARQIEEILQPDKKGEQ